MTRHLLVSADEAIPSNVQHTRPCGDCPWRRDSLPGWLGGMTVDEWVAAAHGDTLIDCHTLKGPQCAGSAIYRRNVAKFCRPPMLKLDADKLAVFATPMEFRKHHEGKKK